jgi:hypothetical protein
MHQMFKDVLLQSRMLLLRQDFLRSIYEFECGIKRGKTLIENKILLRSRKRPYHVPYSIAET